MRRRWGAVLVIAVAVCVTAWIAVASRGSTTKPPAKPGLANPGLANPGQRFGDDADLMRRLERHKLVGKQK